MTITTQDSVDDLRQKGNYEFQRGNLDHALILYTAAIDKCRSDPAFNNNNSNTSLCIQYCNRSACYFRMEDYEKAGEDARQAWDGSNRTMVKAAYRWVKTLLALNDCDTAKNVLTEALALPNLSTEERSGLLDLQKKLTATQKSQQLSKPETSVKGVDRVLSIREFTMEQILGVGNFSEIVACHHKTTGERFALKKLEKKQAADLAKRQHPNVYNEIKMECRVLLERLPPHPGITQMYHSFQDYNTMYYLMDLHVTNPDLWSQLRYKGSMVGGHASCVQRWMWQLVGVLEHLHSHGIVHRDLKPENILVNERNHVRVIDFGTAKDLVRTDLNGPEFVGTPDFMSPEAVTGFSGMPTADSNSDTEKGGADHTADLWALGALLYILSTGTTPFWSPSPYLTFLKIKRGILTPSWGIPSETTWDLVSKLLVVTPAERLGANCYEVTSGRVVTSKGYDVIRQHEYFDSVRDNSFSSSLRDGGPSIVPSLQDFCVRACADLAKQDALDLDICDEFPPGCGNPKHDFLLLDDSLSQRIRHVLDKSKTFRYGDETRVLQRFFANDQDLLRGKVRGRSRDFVGLTQMNDDEYKPSSARGSADPYAKKDDPVPTKICILYNPLLYYGEKDERDDKGAEFKNYLKGFKQCVATINKQRPKAVVVLSNGRIHPKCWKSLCRIRDSIQVLWNDGSLYYDVWLNGFKFLLITTSPSNDEEEWLRQEMEQARMSKPQLFVFCAGHPLIDLPELTQKRLARGRTIHLFGLSKEEKGLDEVIEYEPNACLDDGASVKSTDSEEDSDDAYAMKVGGTNQNGLQWLVIDEKEPYQTYFEPIVL